MRILDLFCKAGGAAVGYSRAFPEAYITGIDIEAQPRYPFGFVVADIRSLTVFDGMLWHGPRCLGKFDLIHASPPCQRFSLLGKRNRNAESHPDLIAATRALVKSMEAHYVIENVPGAPLIHPVTLCGTMFPGLRVLRHRIFETTFPVVIPPHSKHPLVFTHDKRHHHYGLLDQDLSFVQVTGGGNATVANKAAAMGIDWMTGAELNESIPPAYTEYLGNELKEVL